MKLDISALLNKRESYRDFTFSVDPDKVEDSALLPEDITLKGEICVKGRVSDCDGYFMLKATVHADYETRCDRCLAPVSDTVEFPFSRIAVSSSADIEKIGVDEEDVLFVRDGGVDFDRELIEELCLELPVYHLCEEDCPGLCDVCGQRLDGSCKCKKEKEIDPRLESFQKLLEKMKKE
ncbi:MAG: YceD family protein [Clostridia bacterium]|nr:YceD family protein [Clostridia bacterium]